MPTITDRITELIIRHLNGELSKTDEQELKQWMLQSDANRQVAEEFLQDDQLKEGIKDVLSKEIIWKRLEEKTKTGKIVPMYRRRFIRWAVAASILIAITSVFIILTKQKSQPPLIVKQPADVKAPESNRAMITLANGQTVYLDSSENGTLAQQGNVKLVKLANGQIAYQTATGDIIKEIQYNTLSNPRGSKVIDMTLADGSQVWLNAGSSITYPITFIGNERKVNITGEAYFEVSHDASKPFIVSKGETLIQVLGTHFNVNAYDDESDIKVTLLEGSVNVLPGLSRPGTIIKPGEQAQVGTSINVVNNINLNKIMAWKSNKFYFESEDIKTIMRQLSRWYDVEVVYQDEITNHFTGMISRDVNVSKVFEMLQQTGALQVEIEGKKIVIRK